MVEQRLKLLYIIAPSKEGPCKIGYASMPGKRLSSLQIGNPLTLTMFSVWRPRMRSAEQAERLVHSKLQTFLIRGEWYDATVELVEAVMQANWLVRTTVEEVAYRYDRAPGPHDDRLSWLIPA